MTDPPAESSDAEPRPTETLGGKLRAWGGILAAIVLLSWFVWMARDELPEAFRSIRSASPWLLIAAVGAQLGHLVFRSWRWRLLLTPVKPEIGFYNLFSTTVIGYFASALFPFRVGELVRPLMLAGREGIRRSRAMSARSRAPACNVPTLERTDDSNWI